MIRQLIALACASSAAADYVVDWRVPQANDANANAWVENVVVPEGEKVILEWTDYFAFHNVFRMKDKAAYDACDFEGAVELAPSAVVAAARGVLKRFGADEHTYVEVVDAAGTGGSPKSVIIQSRRTGPMFSGIACRPCK